MNSVCNKDLLHIQLITTTTTTTGMSSLYWGHGLY